MGDGIFKAFPSNYTFGKVCLWAEAATHKRAGYIFFDFLEGPLWGFWHYGV
jgi:hypothetical protein